MKKFISASIAFMWLTFSVFGQRANTLSSSISTNEITKIKVWVNAFIPKDISGLTYSVKNSSEKTYLKFPVKNVCDVFSGTIPWSEHLIGSFLTDNRDFDNSLANGVKRSRMHSNILLDILNKKVLAQTHLCGETKQIDAATGRVLKKGTAESTQMGFSAFEYHTDTESFTFNLDGRAQNPLALPEFIPNALTRACVPDIIYGGTFVINMKKREVTFTGYVTEFPAFEIYFSVNGGQPLKLLIMSPKEGADPNALFKGDSEPINTQIKF